MRFVRDNSLSVFFGVIFLLALAGQAIAGHIAFNNDSGAPGDPSRSAATSLPRFGAEVTENWQSEFLQFTLYIFATVWLIQRGSPESKALVRADGSDEDQQVGAYAAEIAEMGPGGWLQDGHLLELPGCSSWS